MEQKEKLKSIILNEKEIVKKSIEVINIINSVIENDEFYHNEKKIKKMIKQENHCLTTFKKKKLKDDEYIIEAVCRYNGGDSKYLFYTGFWFSFVLDKKENVLVDKSIVSLREAKNKLIVLYSSLMDTLEHLDEYIDMYMAEEYSLMKYNENVSDIFKIKYNVPLILYQQ